MGRWLPCSPGPAAPRPPPPGRLLAALRSACVGCLRTCGLWGRLRRPAPTGLPRLRRGSPGLRPRARGGRAGAPGGTLAPSPSRLPLRPARGEKGVRPGSGSLAKARSGCGRPPPSSPGRPLAARLGRPSLRAGGSPRPPSLRLGAALRRGPWVCGLPSVCCGPPCVWWAALAPAGLPLPRCGPPGGSPLPRPLGGVAPSRRLRRPRSSPRGGGCAALAGRLFPPPPPGGLVCGAVVGPVGSGPTTAGARGRPGKL